MTTQGNMTLGEYLRQEREKRGLTIEQVASATKINIRLLHSLEADQYSELPAKPFIRGFVTSYARFIGLDPKEILISFDDFIDKKAKDRPQKDSGHSGYAFEKRDGEQSRTFLWIMMSTFIVLGGLAIFVLKPSLRHQGRKTIAKLRSAQASPSPSLLMAAGTPTPLPSPSPTNVVIAQTTPSATPIAPKPEVQESPKPVDPLNSGKDLKPSQTKHRIVFKALNDIWVRYRVDQKPVMKFVIRKGNVLVLKAQNLALFQCSDVNSVSFSYNGLGYTPMGTFKRLVKYQDTPTLVFPFEISKSIPDPFPGHPKMTQSAPAPRWTQPH